MDKDSLRDKITEKRHSEWEAIAIGIIGLVLVLVALFSVLGSNGFRDMFSFSRVRELRVILTITLLFLGLALMFLGAIRDVLFTSTITTYETTSE